MSGVKKVGNIDALFEDMSSYRPVTNAIKWTPEIDAVISKCRKEYGLSGDQISMFLDEKLNVKISRSPIYKRLREMGLL